MIPASIITANKITCILTKAITLENNKVQFGIGVASTK